jgi:hypothetical protein
LNRTRKHLQHKNIQLTATTYIGDEDYTDQASYLIGKHIDMDFFKDLDKDTLLALIEAAGKDTIMKLYYEHEKINKK